MSDEHKQEAMAYRAALISAKNVLKAISGETLVMFDEVRAEITKIQKVLNSRGGTKQKAAVQQ